MNKWYNISKGNLFVVSAPSGAGKTTLCRKLCEDIDFIRHSVSYTTRKPRPGEIDGIHYSFVDEDEFRSMINEGEFLEWAEVHGNFYGTSKRKVEELVNSGIDVILDIDTQGAKQIRDNWYGSISIFILPPSMEELRNRLTGRMSDPEDVIRKRLQKARDEIREYKNYDYVIVNDIFEHALQKVKAIIIAERSRREKIDHEWVVNKFGL